VDVLGVGDGLSALAKGRGYSGKRRSLRLPTGFLAYLPENTRISVE